MKGIILALGVMLLAGCAGSIQGGTETRLNSDLRVSDYNDASDRYTERPTFVSKVERIGTGEMLWIKVDKYGVNEDLYIPIQSVPDLSAAINKYFEWEGKAKARGDQIDKRIAKIDGWAQFKLDTMFFSASPESHYFVISQCVLGCLSADATDEFLFDRKNSSRLKLLLSDFANGKLKTVDVDAIYQ